MGRKAEQQSLEVRIPTFFRCPISLDIMKSPVSLCTGVTYDRASIQRWLDSGNTTCPATMQPLPSTDLVPNLTLQRLIHLWSSAAPSPSSSAADGGGILRRHHDFARDLRSAADPLPPLRRLSAFISDEDADDYAKNTVVTACAPLLASILSRDPATLETESLEAAIEVLDLILSSNCIDEGSRNAAVSSLAADLDRSVAALIRVLRSGTDLESRIGAARVLEASLMSISDPDSKTRVAEKTDLIPELIRLVGPDEKLDRAAVEAGLGCLVAVLSRARTVRVRMVRMGIVPVLARVLAAEVPAAAAEKGLRLMEAAAGCAEGREAICERAEGCLGAVIGRMMKVGREGTESAVVVLWSLCHLFRDRRAREAVAAAVSDGGIAKFLLLMQSDCSPAARQMAGDLIRIFRVSSKSYLSGYDTKTTHIMPF